MGTHTPPRHHRKPSLRLIVCVLVLLTLLTLLLFSFVPFHISRSQIPSVRVSEPTRAQLLHVESEKELNEKLVVEMEREGLTAEAARLRERPIRYRVFTIETRLNDDMCQVAASAALTGVHVPVVAHDKVSGYITRFKHMLDYIKEEKLSDDDILYVHDSDVIYTGEDIVPHLVHFGLYSPPSPAEVDVAAVRAYDDYGEYRAPDVLAAIRRTPRDQHTYHAAAMRFGLSRSCMAWSSIPWLDCYTSNAYVESVIAAARNKNNASLAPDTVPMAPRTPRRGGLISYVKSRRARGMTMFDTFNNFNAKPEYRTTTHYSNASSSPYVNNFGDDKRLHFYPNYNANLELGFLNAGVFMARVWAFKHLIEVLHRFEETHVSQYAMPEWPDDWWCDQSIFGMLYITTRLWEAEQGLLHSLAPSARAPFPKDPNQLLPGALGVETYAHTVIVMYPQLTPAGEELFPYLTRNTRTGSDQHLATVVDPGLQPHYASFKSKLRRTRSGALLAPPMLMPSPNLNDRIHEKPADFYDKLYRRPLLLHFPGLGKQYRMNRLYPRTSVLFPGLVDPEVAATIRNILENTLLELHTSKGRIFRRYYDVCTSPR